MFLPLPLLASILLVHPPELAGLQSASGLQDPGASAAGRWQEPSPDDGGPPYRVQAASDGRFVLHAEDLLPAAGGRWSGMVDSEVSNQALVLFRQIPGAAGGLHRVKVRMDKHPAASEIGWRLQSGHSSGMSVLFTIVGTPEENSTVPGGTQPPWGLPDHAKAPPRDFTLWASEVRDLLLQIQNDTGQLPDYVELWNEPDLDLWWTGTASELRELYRVFATTLRATFQDAIRIGGCGLGRARSVGAGDDETFLEELVDFAAAQGLPLDFLSWHNYEQASSARFFEPAEILRTRLGAKGFQDAELLITEWNIFGRAEGHPRAIEFDGSHAAAQFAGVLTSIAEEGIDGHCFFLLQDGQTDFWSVTDLLGDPGVLTRRGIMKPVWRMAEFLLGMAGEERVRVEWPRNEWAVSVVATRLGDRIRVVVANDTVDADWVWAEGCRERGTEPGRLWNALETVLQAGQELRIDTLMAQGLDQHEAATVLQVLPLAQEASVVRLLPRSVTLEVAGSGHPLPDRVWRFDSEHNAPAAHREEFLPILDWVEDQASYVGWQAASQVLIQNGITPPPYGSFTMPRTPVELADILGISLELAIEVWDAYVLAVTEARMDHVDLLNSQPAAVVQPEAPLAAGLELQGDTMRFAIEPDSVTVIDFFYR